MKNFAIFLFGTVLLLGCKPEKLSMDYKNKKIGLSVKGTDMKCAEVKMIIDGKTVERKQFILGEKVTLEFRDIEGFKRVKGSVYPELDITVKNSDGSIVLDEKNLLDGASKSESKIKVSAYLVAQKFGDGNNYIAEITVRDTKGKGVIQATMPFEIIPNPNLIVSKDNVDCDLIYLWDDVEKKVVTKEYVKPNRMYYLIFNKLEGVEYPIVPLEIIDGNNKILFSDENILADITSEELIKVKEQFSAKFSLGSLVKNPITIRCLVNDKKSENFLEVETTVKVQ